VEIGAAINARIEDSDDEYDKTTSLYLAAENGRADIVKLLLENGADVDGALFDEESDDGYYFRTPLSVSIERGDSNVVQLLLENGADIDIIDDAGRTALHWMASKADEAMVRLVLEKDAGVEVNIEV
jgi:ankyrin repeat protein